MLLIARLTAAAMYGSKLVISSDALNGNAASGSPIRPRSNLSMEELNISRSFSIPCLVLMFFSLVSDPIISDCSLADILPTCCDNADVKVSLSFGAILKLSKKLFRKFILRVSSGPLSRTPTSCPLGGSGGGPIGRPSESTS